MYQVKEDEKSVSFQTAHHQIIWKEKWSQKNRLMCNVFQKEKEMKWVKRCRREATKQKPIKSYPPAISMAMLKKRKNRIQHNMCIKIQDKRIIWYHHISMAVCIVAVMWLFADAYVHRLRYEYGQSLQAKDVNISILSLRTDEKNNSAREKKTGCSAFPIRLVQFFVRFFVCVQNREYLTCMISMLPVKLLLLLWICAIW